MLKMNCYISETESGSVLKWDCDAAVGGTIASVGNRVFGGVAKFLQVSFSKIFKKKFE